MVQPVPPSEIPKPTETPTISKFGQDRPGRSFFRLGSKPEQLTLIGSLVKNIEQKGGESPVFQEGQRSFETSLINLHEALQNERVYNQNPDAYDAMYFSYMDALATANNIAPNSREATTFEQNYSYSPEDFLDMIGTTQILKQKKFARYNKYKTPQELTKAICFDAQQELQLLEAAYSPKKAFSWWENRIIETTLKKGDAFDTGTNLEVLAQKGKQSLKEKVTLPSGQEITIGNYNLEQRAQRTQLIVDMTRSRHEEILNPKKEELKTWAEEVDSALPFVKEATKEDNFSLLEQKILEQHLQINSWRRNDLFKNYQDLFNGGEPAEIALSFTTISPEAKQKATELLHLPSNASHDQIQKALLKLKTDNQTEYSNLSNQMLTVIDKANQNLNPHQAIELAINFYTFKYKEAQLEILAPVTSLEQLPSEFFDQIESQHIAFLLLQKDPIRQLTQHGISQEQIDEAINTYLIKEKGKPYKYKQGIEDEIFDEKIDVIQDQKLKDFDQNIQDQAKKEIEKEVSDDDEKLEQHYGRLIDSKILERKAKQLQDQLISNLPEDFKQNQQLMTFLNELDSISNLLQGKDITPIVQQMFVNQPQLFQQFQQYAMQQQLNFNQQKLFQSQIDNYEQILRVRTTQEGKDLFNQAKTELLNSSEYEAKTTTQARELAEADYTKKHMPHSQLDELSTLSLAALIEQGYKKKTELPQDLKDKVDQITTGNRFDPKKFTTYLSSRPQSFSALDWITISLFIDTLKQTFSSLDQDQEQQIQQLGGLV